MGAVVVAQVSCANTFPSAQMPGGEMNGLVELASLVSILLVCLGDSYCCQKADLRLLSRELCKINMATQGKDNPQSRINNMMTYRGQVFSNSLLVVKVQMVSAVLNCIFTRHNDSEAYSKY
ncbi:hypothetical protein AMECASPLE_025864 [Ameca splendens]|uniref:Uncharacterized protein n=1 Tax=Ameca splendens TaxID=208324 RepID=A0ABV0YRQ7_9TELE